MKQIILASSSFRRQELLKWLGVSFQIHVSGFEEEGVKFEEFDDPEEYVATIAWGKVLMVAKDHPDDVVIGSDTIVVLDGITYGKPRDLDHARAMLKALRGRTHTVYTAVVIQDNETQEKRTEIVKSFVTFFPFSDDALERYIATSEPYDKAGGYALQGVAKQFVEKVEGSAMNVVGFPILTVRDMLEELGMNITVDVEASIFEKTGYRS